MVDHERLRNSNGVDYNTLYNSHSTKMESDFSPRKTMIIVVIVVGCFAVLWPKVFHPMLIGSANQHMKPSSIDKTTGCCDVISETDVNTIKIMSELCGSIIKQGEKPLLGRELLKKCQTEVSKTCGIDLSLVLQEQVRLGQSMKNILDEIRSLNGSLCLKYNFGVPPWRLGVPHRVTLKLNLDKIRQERPTNIREELVHPAFRERGRAIPHTQAATQSPPKLPPRVVVEGRPGPIPGMRPTLGGAGHVVAPSKQGTGSMGIVMPIYTIGIVIFFAYTLMKILFKKQPEGVGGVLYPPVEPDAHFRRDVFESDKCRQSSRLSRDGAACKLVVNAMSVLLDEVDQELETRRNASEVLSQDEPVVNRNLSNGNVKKEEQSRVKVMGMETTASCEGGQKWKRPESPVLPNLSHAPQVEEIAPPQEIYLEGSLPPQSQLLVANSATLETQDSNEDDPAVVLAGKVTLSVISLSDDNHEIGSNQVDEKSHDGPLIEVNGLQKVRDIDVEKAKPILRKEIDDIVDIAIENMEAKKHEKSTDVSDIVTSNDVEHLTSEQIANVVDQVQSLDLKEEDDEPEVSKVKGREDFITFGNEVELQNIPNVDCSNVASPIGGEVVFELTEALQEQLGQSTESFDSVTVKDSEVNNILLEDSERESKSDSSSYVSAPSSVNTLQKTSSEESTTSINTVKEVHARSPPKGDGDVNFGAANHDNADFVDEEEEEEEEEEEITDEESEEEVIVSDDDDIIQNEVRVSLQCESEDQNRVNGGADHGVDSDDNEEDIEEEEVSDDDEEIIEEVEEIEYTDEEDVEQSNETKNHVSANCNGEN